jgi:hypothetical protein
LDSAGLEDSERLGGGVTAVARFLLGDNDLDRCLVVVVAVGNTGDNDFDLPGDDAGGDFERDLERDFLSGTGLEDLAADDEDEADDELRRRLRSDATDLALDLSLSVSEDDEEEDEEEEDLELSSSLSDELLSSSPLELLFSSSELSTAELSESFFFNSLSLPSSSSLSL